MKKLFTKYMFLVVLIIYVMGFIFADESFGVNKTVGWAYDISNQIFYNAIFFWFSKYLSVFGYLLLAILRRKTNYNFSIIHFVLIIGTILLMAFKCFVFSTVLCLFSIAVFIKNIIGSYK